MGRLSVFQESIVRGVRSYFPANRDTTSADAVRQPTTHLEWVDRYNFREAAYLGLSYTVEEVRRLKLFRAVDPTGQTIALTRRLTRDVQHVVDTDAQALAGRDLRLVSKAGEGEDEDEVDDARGIWARSKVSALAGRWARISAGLGDIHWEAVRLSATAPYDVRIVGYDPRFVELEYDAETQTEIVKAVIQVPFQGRDEDGIEITRVYTRILTAEAITVMVDGVVQTDRSGDHGLGVVPLVHVPFIPWTDPAHGLWAAEGLDSPLSLVDSLLTQMQAIGNRYASPIWVAMGFRLKAGADLGMGRVLAIPDGASFTPVEPALSGVRTLLDAAEATRALARETLPEFLFTDAGASASGSALNFRASAFVSKMEEVRGRWYAGLATVTEYGLALERGLAYDPEVAPLRVDAPPVLPVNTEGVVALLGDVMDKGGLKRQDYIRHLQRLDLVPGDVDPETYAREVVEEAAILANVEARALADVAALVAGVTIPGGPTPPPGGASDALAVADTLDDAPTDVDAGEVVQVATEDGDVDPVALAETAAVAEASMNGAQVAAILQIVGQVAAGEMPRDTGLEIMQAAFGLTREAADRIMGTVGAGFTPTPDA